MVNCIYIHIPFCEKKCKYCAFCSFALLKKQNIYINSLTNEINSIYKKELLDTIYFGGGTPSLIDTKNIEIILKNLIFNKQTEITLELNPHNITFEKLKEYKQLGINRLSIGIQSFNDKLLKEIGRTHTEKEIYQTIENIDNLGFENYSIDLMYGLPNQTMKIWDETLNKALQISPKHISLYGLKIEQGTYYSKHSPENLPSLDIQANMYELAIEKLKTKYQHYEFSNFAIDEKFYSKHNLNYWNCENYYGVGLSASGYINNKRYTNTYNFNEYITCPEKKQYTILSKEEQIEEEIFLGLRKTEGINFKKINKKYDIDIYEKYKKEFNKYIDTKLMEKTKSGVKLTLRGILLSNEILCDFIELND